MAQNQLIMTYTVNFNFANVEKNDSNNNHFWVDMIPNENKGS
jgi:hypothetical protein